MPVRLQSGVFIGLVAALAAVLLLSSARHSGASCVRDESYQPAPPAFAGEVVWVDAWTGLTWDDGTRVEAMAAFLLVEEAWGTEIETPVVLTTPAGYTNGARFEEGDRYLVFGEPGRSEPFRLTTCSDSGTLARPLFQGYRDALGPPTARRSYTPNERAAMVEEIRASLLRSRTRCAEAGSETLTFQFPIGERTEQAVRWVGEEGQVLIDGLLTTFGDRRDTGWHPSEETRETYVQLLGFGKGGCWVRACVEIRTEGKELWFVPERLAEDTTHMPRGCQWLLPNAEGNGIRVRGIPLGAESAELTLELRASGERPKEGESGLWRPSWDGTERRRPAPPER